MNVYEVLLRHQEQLKNALIIGNGAQLPESWQTQIKTLNSQILTWDWQTWQAYHNLNNKQRQFAIPQQQIQQQNPAQVILLWPKSKALGVSLIQLIASQIKSCLVVGANDAGGKSIGKACAQLCISSEKIDSARHCSVWKLELKTQPAFNWLNLAQSFNHQQQSYLTLPGVFSHGKLDVGTQVLLEHLPAPAHGSILDIGCGSGVIGLSLKQTQPSLELTLTDVDAFALRSAELNALRMGLKADIVASDGLQQLEKRFDYIISNPPFHQGKATDYRFAEQLFQQAKQHLVNDGQLWIVANRHLPYEEWAESHFNQIDILAQQQGFKIICLSQAQ